MLIKSYLALLYLASGIVAWPRNRQYALKQVDKDEDSCPKAYVIGVRGTLEQPGLGAMQPIADAILKKIPGSDYLAIEYPAAGIITDDDDNWVISPFLYSASKTQGGDVLRNELEMINYNCPKTPVILMGYSQGAHVVGDALCGVLPGIWPARHPVSDEVKKSIRAVIQFGDPSNVRDLPWHKGSAEHGGIVPRQSFANCKDLKDSWQSYCDKSDIFCDRGKSVEVHKKYVNNYQDDVVDFVLNKVKSSVNCATSNEL